MGSAYSSSFEAAFFEAADDDGKVSLEAANKWADENKVVVVVAGRGGGGGSGGGGGDGRGGDGRGGDGGGGGGTNSVAGAAAATEPAGETKSAASTEPVKKTNSSVSFYTHLLPRPDHIPPNVFAESVRRYREGVQRNLFVHYQGAQKPTHMLATTSDVRIGSTTCAPIAKLISDRTVWPWRRSERRRIKLTTISLSLI